MTCVCCVRVCDVSGMCVLYGMYMWYVVCICECESCVCLWYVAWCVVCSTSGVYGICVLCVSV